MANQTLVQLAGEQGDAVHPSVVAEPIAGDAHLAATAGFQEHFVAVGPSVVLRFSGELQKQGVVT